MIILQAAEAVTSGGNGAGASGGSSTGTSGGNGAGASGGDGTGAGVGEEDEGIIIVHLGAKYYYLSYWYWFDIIILKDALWKEFIWWWIYNICIKFFFSTCGPGNGSAQTYIGCAIDKPIRALPDWPYYSPNITLEWCFEKCEGFQYAGIEVCTQ